MECCGFPMDYCLRHSAVCVPVQCQRKAAADRNNRGWWLLLVFVPLLGWIVGLLLLIECGFLKGTSGTNRFGPDPLC